MVVGKLLRLAGHGEHDDARYIPPDLRDKPFGGDCLPLARERLLDEKWLSQDELDELVTTTQESVDEAVARAQSEPDPNPFRESWHALATKHLAEGTLPAD